MRQTLVPWRTVERLEGQDWVAFIAVTWAVVVAVLIGIGGNLADRGAIFAAALPLVVAVVSRSIRGTLIGLAVWLIALGLARRLIASGTGSGVSNDPLLLVGPAVIGVLFLVASARGTFRRATPLASSVLLLSVLALVEAFNPLQGGILIGLGGLLLVLFPMLAFWVGRELLDGTTLRQLLRVVAVLAALDAVYGLVQQFAGFPSWDVRWVNTSGIVALNINGFTRSFGSLSSAQEYAIFLTIGLVLWITLFSWGHIAWVTLQLAAIGAIVVAFVLESERTSLVLVVLTLGALAAARSGRRPTGAVIVAAVFLVLLYVGVNQFLPQSPTQGNPTNATAAFTGHLISGIADPTGQASTFSGHFNAQVNGVESGITHPVGHGTGSITIAASHLGNGALLGTEFDIGNSAVAFGFAGFLLYLVVAWRALSAVYRRAATRKDALSLAILGIAGTTLLQWLNGDLYAVAWLFWLTLGWVDSQAMHEAAELGPTIPSLVKA